MARGENQVLQHTNGVRLAQGKDINGLVWELEQVRKEVRSGYEKYADPREQIAHLISQAQHLLKALELLARTLWKKDRTLEEQQHLEAQSQGMNEDLKVVLKR